VNIVGVAIKIYCILFEFIHILFVSFQGVMEAIRISCAGFPTRKPFVEFVDRFGLLAPEVLDGRYFDCFYLLSDVLPNH
jgi:hypothetical protein